MTLVKVVSVAALVILTAAAVSADNSGRIYGKITTVDGDVFEGLIRWDKNEVSWVDMLDGTRDLDEKYVDMTKEHCRDKETSIEIFGITIAKSGSSWSWSNSAQSGVRFGNIRRIEVIDDDRALIVLKSGQEVELEGSSDIGDGIREIIIEDPDEGEVELVWEDLESVEFREADRDIGSNFGDRLYGTLTTRRGDKFTGWVTWDIDEVCTRDILDGDEGNRSRKIRFDKIAAIERYSSSGATVHLVNGEKVTLRGSNDVDDDNRGIIIADPALGQVIVEWDEFDRLDFETPQKAIRYGDFDGGRPLMGTVYTEDGNSYTGRIHWDADEANTWEILDGSYRDIDFDVVFGLIKRIDKRTSRSSVVTVSDGREFRLRDSNDVDGDNKGIIITTDDSGQVVVEWDDFDYVEFES